MARRVDPEVHSVKRDAFVDTAQQLIQSKGYDAMSIQDILDAVGASKGAFYHYFGSKGDLLEAVIDRIVEGILAAETPILHQPGLTGLERLQGVFELAGRFKSDRRDLMVALLEPWYADANALVRDRVNRATIERLTPLISDLLVEGQGDGSVRVGDPTATAAIVMAMLVASGDALRQLFLDRLEGRITFEEVARRIHAYDEAIARILGLPDRGFRLISDDLLHATFG